MNKSIYRAQLTTQGFSLVRRYLNDEFLDSLRDQCDRVLAELPQAHREEYKSQGSLVNLGDHPEFSGLIRSPELQELLQNLDVGDYRWLAGYLISKPPHSPSLFWHQDWWGWDHSLSYSSRLPGVGVMIYLSNTTRDNGCLRVIPGSHRRWHRLHGLPVAHEQSLSQIDDPGNIAYKTDESEQAVEVGSGDVVLIDPRLLHSAYANQTNDERSLVTLWYLPEFEFLPESIQARYVRIFNRQELDTGDNAAGELLDDWPEEHRQAVGHLVPTYEGTAKPHPWNRAPDQDRMLPCNDEQMVG